MIRDVMAVFGIGGTKASLGKLRTLREGSRTGDDKADTLRLQELNKSAVKLRSVSEKNIKPLPTTGFAEDSVEGGTSLGNCVLAAMGVPLIVRRCAWFESDTAQAAAGAGGAGGGAAAPASEDAPHSVELSGMSTGSTAETEGLPSDTSDVSQASPSGPKETKAELRRIGLRLEVEESDDLCNALHGNVEWRARGAKTFSLRMVYVTKTRMEVNYNPDCKLLDTDIVQVVFENGLCLVHDLLPPAE